MRAALVLMNLEENYLRRGRLWPRRTGLLERVEDLRAGCRSRGLPILNLQIHAEASPSPRSSLPPSGERTFTQPHDSAFSDPAFEAALRNLEITTLVIAGLDLHADIASTSLDALARGLGVWIADDAAGTVEVELAELTRIFLEGRGANFASTSDLLTRLGLSRPPVPPRISFQHTDPAFVDGRWLDSEGCAWVASRNPSEWSETLATVALATDEQVGWACTSAATAQRTWARHSAEARASVLRAWADQVACRGEAFARLLALEIGKPITEGRDEVRRAVAHIRAAADVFGADDSRAIASEPPLEVRSRPLGVVGLLTPWNNPLAIPAGKIAPALGAGNSVVWKPAPEAPLIAIGLVESLQATPGLDPGLVSLVFGDARVARRICDDSRVAAVSLTGSIETGRSVAVRCVRLGKPLQAELGANNAAIVLPDCNFASEARGMALSAFSFAGQRCTAIRRFIVVRDALPEFQSAFLAAIEALRLGDPLDETTEVGPLISRVHSEQIRFILGDAVASGARVLCGGTVPAALEAGCWLSPAVVMDASPGSRIALEETFGPVAVVLPVDDLAEAIDVANSVEHGLVAAIHTRDDRMRHVFVGAIEAGIVKMTRGALPVSAEAPFGGWKASRIGPPEHGVWDREFFTRPQAIYGSARVVLPEPHG